MRDFSYDSAQYDHFNNVDEAYIKSEFYHKTGRTCDYLELYPIGDGRYYALSITDDYSGSYTDVWLLSPENETDKNKREIRQAKSAERAQAAKAKADAKKKVEKEAAIKDSIAQLEKAGYKVIK